MPRKNKKGEYVFSDYPDFTPNKSPKEMFHEGIFGGTYFRKIHSGVLNKNLSDVYYEFPKAWFSKFPCDLPKEDKSINKYKVHSGSSLKYWESRGWIKKQDPYGWIQWYCRFWLGRRSADDERQINRWKGICKGRFQKNLINQCIRKNAKYNDASVSPVIRQLLLQWGYELTAKDLLIR